MQRTDHEISISIPKAQGTLEKQEDFKSQKIRVPIANSFTHDRETVP